jgi:hypothetical protein
MVLVKLNGNFIGISTMNYSPDRSGNPAIAIMKCES